MKARMFSDPGEIASIISRCEVCNLAMVDSMGDPYVIPMNFGYREGYIYFHSGPGGRKIDLLRQNPKACVSFSTDHELYVQSEQVACSYGMKYKSVIAQGRIEFIEDFEAKIEGLNVIMSQYTNRSFQYNSPAVKNVAVFRMVIEDIMGKEFGHL